MRRIMSLAAFAMLMSASMTLFDRLTQQAAAK